MENSVLVLLRASIVNQGVSLTYLEDSYDDTEDALDEVITIINNTDLSKAQIRTELLKIKDLEHVEFEQDTVFLDKIYLVFKSAWLTKIGKQF